MNIYRIFQVYYWTFQKDFIGFFKKYEFLSNFLKCTMRFFKNLLIFIIFSKYIIYEFLSKNLKYTTGLFKNTSFLINFFTYQNELIGFFKKIKQF